MRYLSDEWLKAADEAIATVDVGVGMAAVAGDASSGEGATAPTGAASTAVGVTVLDGPDGDRRYQLVLDPTNLRVLPGADGAGVSMTMSYDVSAAIAQGHLSAQRAFLDGDVRLGGDVALLLGDEAVKALANINDCFSQLRASTVY